MLRVKNYMELYFDGVGRILLADEDGRLTELSFLKERALPAGLNLEETPLLREARRQLEEYFDGSRRAFELPLAPKGFRAAGLANNRNPIAIIIPCHRVIGSNGKLVGFGGGLEVKAFLLRFEAAMAAR